MDYWNIPKWGVFFLVAKNCHLATKKGGGGLPLAKKHFFGIKKAYHILKGEKKKRELNSPYLDHRFFVCCQYIGVGLIKILLFSLTFTQIWLNPCPLVKHHQSTYLTKLKKKTLKFPTRLAATNIPYL
jgi:hypothetical protein